MDIMAFIVVWLFSGVVGSVFVLEFGWRRGEIPLDVTVCDIFLGALTSISGPINLVIGIFFLLGWCLRGTVTFNTCRVVFPARNAN